MEVGMGEVFETKFTTDKWMDRHGTQHVFFNLPLKDELVGTNIEELFEEDPDDQEHKFTGNEGANVENLYHTALLLVIAPRDDFFRNLVHSVPVAAVNYLQTLIAKYHQTKTNKSDETSQKELEQMQQYFQWILDSSSDLSSSYHQLMSFCTALHYPRGLPAILPLIRSLPDQLTVDRLFSFLDVVDRAVWFDHAQTVEIEKNKETHPKNLCTLLNQLINRGDCTAETKVLGLHVATAIFQQQNSTNFALYKSKLLYWSTEELLSFLRILLFVYEPSLLDQFTEFLVSKGNQLTEDAPVHCLLAKKECWDAFRATKPVESFVGGGDTGGIKWLGILGLERIKVLNTLKPVDLNTWAYPEANFPDNSELTEFRGVIVSLVLRVGSDRLRR